MSEDLTTRIEPLHADFERYLVESEKTIYDLTQQLRSMDCVKHDIVWFQINSGECFT